MQFNNFVGIDISKNTFDLALIKDNNASVFVSAAFSNTHSGLVHLEEFLKKQGLKMEETLFCMEHTGIYCRLLSQYLTERKYAVWIEMPVKIIHSLGLQRGKNDRLDAKRLAEYACSKKSKAVLWDPPREVIIQINRRFDDELDLGAPIPRAWLRRGARNGRGCPCRTGPPPRLRRVPHQCR